MKLENAIEVKDVSMCFNLSREKVDSIKEYVIKMLKRQLFYEEFWALKDVSFEIRKGDSVGLIGMNGSGKSTMLKIIAGVLKPTKGTVETTGTIAPMIELGAGFDHDLTARENIFLNGALIGYSQEMLEERFDDIISFAGSGALRGCAYQEFFIRYAGPPWIFHRDHRRRGHSDHRRDSVCRRLSVPE